MSNTTANFLRLQQEPLSYYIRCRGCFHMDTTVASSQSSLSRGGRAWSKFQGSESVESLAPAEVLHNTAAPHKQSSSCVSSTPSISASLRAQTEYTSDVHLDDFITEREVGPIPNNENDPGVYFFTRHNLLPPIPAVLYSQNITLGPSTWHLEEEKNAYELTRVILYLGGKDRFPPLSYTLFVDPAAHNEDAQPVDPGTFTKQEFADIWEQESDPTRLSLTRDMYTQERYYQDVVWTIQVPDIQICTIIKRGTIFIVDGFDSTLVRYIAVFCRYTHLDRAFIQLNAYTYRGHRLRFNNENWPTLLISVPIEFSNIVMAKDIIYKPLREIKAPKKAIWRRFKSKWRHVFDIVRSCMGNNKQILSSPPQP